MTSSANNRGFSRMGVDPTVGGLVDGTDFPHSALFHALNIATQGNYAIIDGNDFDITQSDSSGKTQFAVAAGKVVRDGVLQAAVSTANFTQGTPSSFEEPTSGFSYYLLVVNSSNALALKDNGGTILNDIVPNPATTDIPIAVLRLGAGETTTQRHVQFLTTTKNANSLSIAYDNSGYTEAMSVSATADRTTFKNKVANADIRFILADNTADEKFEILTDDDSDGDEGDTTVFSVDGLGATTIAGTLNLGSVVAAGTDTDKFLVLDSGGNVDFRAGSDVASDIGAATALNDLSDVSYSSGDLTITSLDKIVFANGANAELSVAATGSGTDGRDLTISAGSAPTGSANQNGGDLILNAGGGDGTGTSIMTFNTKVNGTDAVAERMRVHSDGSVGIGTATPTTKLEVEGDTTISRSSDSGQTRTLIVEGARNATGTDYARIDLKNYDSHGPTSYVGARISAMNEATGVNDGTLVFSTNNANAGITERMRIKDSGEVVVSGELEIDGSLNHDGSNVGFYGTAPATKTTVAALGAQSINPDAGGGNPGAAEHATTQTAITNLQAKLDALIGALNSVGLV